MPRDGRAGVYDAVADAVRSGLLEKPERCPRCERRRYSGDIHAHHHDGYEDPLRVVWLCRWCHIAEHKAQRHAAAPAGPCNAQCGRQCRRHPDGRVAKTCGRKICTKRIQKNLVWGPGEKREWPFEPPPPEPS